MNRKHEQRLMHALIYGGTHSPMELLVFCEKKWYPAYIYLYPFRPELSLPNKNILAKYYLSLSGAGEYTSLQSRPLPNKIILLNERGIGELTDNKLKRFWNDNINMLVDFANTASTEDVFIFTAVQHGVEWGALHVDYPGTSPTALPKGFLSLEGLLFYNSQWRFLQKEGYLTIKRGRCVDNIIKNLGFLCIQKC